MPETPGRRRAGGWFLGWTPFRERAGLAVATAALPGGILDLVDPS